MTLILLTAFAFLSYIIFETQALSVQNNQQLYLTQQARLHKRFFKTYIDTLTLETCPQKIKIELENFNLEAYFEYENLCSSDNNNQATVDIFITSTNKKLSIRQHERLIKKL